MAATDQTYRNQKALDVVFAVSCLLMLASILWMFAQDYNREFKTEQRQFRDVEAALAQRVALEKLPPIGEFKAATKAVEDARKSKDRPTYLLLGYNLQALQDDGVPLVV